MTADFSLHVKGSFKAFKALSPPNIPSIPPKEDSITVLLKASKAGVKSVSSIIGSKSIFFSSLTKNFSNCSFVKNSFIIRFLIALLNVSNLSTMTPDPYKKGTFSKSI